MVFLIPFLIAFDLDLDTRVPSGPVLSLYVFEWMPITESLAWPEKNEIPTCKSHMLGFKMRRGGTYWFGTKVRYPRSSTAAHGCSGKRTTCETRKPHLYSHVVARVPLYTCFVPKLFPMVPLYRGPIRQARESPPSTPSHSPNVPKRKEQ
jgi:hypothetical protein